MKARDESVVRVYEGRTDLARLSRSQQQHFDFVFGQHFIALELVFDLIVACRRSEQLCGKSARGEASTHEPLHRCRHRWTVHNPL